MVAPINYATARLLDALGEGDLVLSSVGTDFASACGWALRLRGPTFKTVLRAAINGSDDALARLKVARPGSVGDASYSPFIRIDNAGGHIYNAPVIAFGVSATKIASCHSRPDYNVVHDRVLHVCPNGGKNGGGTVTLHTTPVFSFARPSLYISMEASDPVPATLDQGTLAPAMADAPTGRDDSAFSAIERLFVIANGPMGANNPQRQGLNSAIHDKGPGGKPLPPIQVIGGIPTIALDYSPLWDLNLGVWTRQAVAKGYRSRLIDEFQYLDMVRKGWITGPKGKRFGSTGIVVNCPIVMRLL